MKFRRVVLLPVLALLLAASAVRAGENGGYLPALLGFSVGGRANCLANTFVAVSDDPSAIYWNPAGMFQMKAREVMIQLYNNFNSSLSIYYLGFVNPLNTENTLGLSVLMLNMDNFVRYSANGLRAGDFSVRQYLLSLAYGRAISQKFSLGTTFKLFYQTLGSLSATPITLDFGMMVKPAPFLSFGLNLKNLIPFPFDFGGPSETIPPQALAGMKLSILKDRIFLTADVSKVMIFSDLSASDLKWNAGLGIFIFESLGVMAGVNSDLRFSGGISASMKDVHLTTGMIQNSAGSADIQFSLSYKMKEITQTGKELDYFYKGTVYYNSKDYRNAIKYFQKVIEIRNDPTAQYYLDNSRKYLASDQWMTDEEKELIRYNIDRAKKARSENDAGTAIQAYRDVLNVNPENKEALDEIDGLKKQVDKDVRAYYNEALSLYKLNRYKDSLDKVKFALSLNPEHEPSLELKSKNENAMKDIIAAEQKKDQQQTEARTLFDEGLARYRQENWAEAISYFQKSLEIISDSTNVMVYLAKAQDNLKASKSAEDRKHDAERFYKNGLAAYQAQRLKEAIGEFEKAVNTYPDYKEANDALTKAEAEYDQLINGPLEAGKAFLRDNKLGDAIVSFQKVLDLDPENAIGKEYLSRAQGMKKDAILRYVAQADISFKQQKYSDALKDYRQALILDPESNPAADGVKNCRARLNEQIQKYLDLGMQQYNDGLYNKAIDTFQTVLGIDPDQPIAKDYSGKSKDMYEKNKTVIQQKESLDKGKEAFVNRDFAGAKRYFQTVVEIDARSAAGQEASEYILKCDDSLAKSSKEDLIAERFTRGIIDFKNQRYDKAVSNWRVIKEIDPENKFVDSYISYAETAKQERGNKNYQDGVDAFKKGDLISARDNFNKAIQVDPKHQKAKEYLSKVNTQIISIVQASRQKAEDARGKGDYAAAIAQYDDILKYEPENEDINEQKALCENILDLLTKGETALQNREYGDAYDYFDRVVGLNPNDSRADQNRTQAAEGSRKQEAQMMSDAEQFINSGDLRKAQSRLSAVVKANPNNQQAKDRMREVEDLIESQLKVSYQKAVDYYNAGKWSLALQEFNRVLDLRNPYKDAFSFKEKAQREKGKLDAQASQSFQNDIRRLLDEARDLYRDEKLDLAIDRWQKVLQMDPNNKDAQNGIARAKYKKQQGE